jgi:hypothetical protein
MEAEKDPYRKVIEILRDSRPDLIGLEEIENEVISRIRHKKHQDLRFSDLFDSLFGWVYFGWIRRSLIGAAVILFAFFIYQQAFILKQVNIISKQVVIKGNESIPASAYEFDKKLTLYKISARLSGDREIQISESQLKELLDSYENLQVKYKDLIRIIEENPELKKYFENKLDKERKNKPDI